MAQAVRARPRHGDILSSCILSEQHLCPANKIVRTDIVRSCPLSSSVLFCPTLSPFVLFCPTRICPNLSDPKSTDIYRHYPILSSFVRTESVRICPIRILPISSDILICPINACFYPLLSSFVRKKPLNSLYPCPLPPAILHPSPNSKFQILQFPTVFPSVRTNCIMKKSTMKKHLKLKWIW